MNEDIKKYQLTEDMAQGRTYWMTKIMAGPYLREIHTPRVSDTQKRIYQGLMEHVRRFWKPFIYRESKQGSKDDGQGNFTQ